MELGQVCHGCLCCLGSQSIQKDKKRRCYQYDNVKTITAQIAYERKDSKDERRREMILTIIEETNLQEKTEERTMQVFLYIHIFILFE